MQSLTYEEVCWLAGASEVVDRPTSERRIAIEWHCFSSATGIPWAKDSHGTMQPNVVQAKPKKKIAVTTVAAADAPRSATGLSAGAGSSFMGSGTDATSDPRAELLRSQSFGGRPSTLSPFATAESAPPTQAPSSSSSAAHVPPSVAQKHSAQVKELYQRLCRQELPLERLLVFVVAAAGASAAPLPSHVAQDVVDDVSSLATPAYATHFLATLIVEHPPLVASFGVVVLHRLQQSKALVVVYPQAAKVLLDSALLHAGGLEAPNFGAETWTMTSLVAADHAARDGDDTRRDQKTKEAKAMYTERENCFDAFRSLLHRCEGHVHKANT
eukprot:gene19726-14326_t